jgi:hypothetical protein
MINEQHQDQKFFSLSRLQEQRPQPQEPVLGSRSSEEGFLSRKLGMIENRAKIKPVCFVGEITGKKATTSKKGTGF